MKPSKINILCVDGQRAMHNVLTYLLEQQGFNVTTAHNPTDAVKLAQGQQFDLYILDSWLPQGAEYELCQQIRKFDATTPVLFYSDRDADAGVQGAFAAGGQGHLRKPAYPKKLIQVVSELLGEVKPAKKKSA